LVLIVNLGIKFGGLCRHLRPRTASKPTAHLPNRSIVKNSIFHVGLKWAAVVYAFVTRIVYSVPIHSIAKLQTSRWPSW